MKKRAIPILLAAVLLLPALSACGGGDPPSSELTVFAAASLTETLTEIEAMYEKDHPGAAVTFNFDSSGALLAQIREGADCDLFLSAAQGQMDELEAEGALAEGSRTDLLENQVVLCASGFSSTKVDSFDTLAEKLKSGELLLAMGGGDVPVGQYTRKILDYCGLDEEALAAAGHITYGSNVKEVAVQVKEGSVDCGVIYATDAFSAGLIAADTAGADMCGRVVYPAAVLKGSGDQKAARDFLDYLKTDGAMAVFERVGFLPAGSEG